MLARKVSIYFMYYTNLVYTVSDYMTNFNHIENNTFDVYEYTNYTFYTQSVPITIRYTPHDVYLKCNICAPTPLRPASTSGTCSTTYCSSASQYKAHKYTQYLLYNVLVFLVIKVGYLRYIQL